jgi:hypothetical protein
LGRQEENPEISEPKLFFWDFEDFPNFSIPNFCGNNVSFSVPHETKDKKEVMKSVFLTL